MVDLHEWVQSAGAAGGFAGIWLAFRQLRVAVAQLKRTATAAESTRDAVNRNQQHLAYSQALLLLPQLQNIEREIDEAVQDGRNPDVQRALLRWRDSASQLGAFLERRGLEDADLKKALEKSVDDSKSAKGALVDQAAAGEEGKTAAEITKTARQSIENVCAKLGALSGKLLTDSEGDNANA